MADCRRSSASVQRVLTKQRLEPTVLRFIGNTLSVALHVTLVVAILGYFERRPPASQPSSQPWDWRWAWPGPACWPTRGRRRPLLLVLRPFKVGDFHFSAGGITGVVHEIGLFVTTFDTPDNIRTFVANNKIFSDTIQNYSANAYRRVDLTAQISGAADPHAVIARLRERVATVANVAKEPAPDVTILTFSPFGPVLAVRPYCHNDVYWQVYFDTNMVIREVCGDAAFPGPAYPLAVHEVKSSAASA